MAGIETLFGAALGGLKGLRGGAQAGELGGEYAAATGGLEGLFSGAQVAGMKERKKREEQFLAIKERAGRPIRELAPAVAATMEAKGLGAFADLPAAAFAHMGPVLKAVGKDEDDEFGGKTAEELFGEEFVTAFETATKAKIRGVPFSTVKKAGPILRTPLSKQQADAFWRALFGGGAEPAQPAGGKEKVRKKFGF